jgi:hypothetical protein
LRAISADVRVARVEAWRPARERAITQMMEMTMKKIMYIVALGLAVMGAGEVAFAQGVHTGTEENLESGYGNSYQSGRY